MFSEKIAGMPKRKMTIVMMRSKPETYGGDQASHPMMITDKSGMQNEADETPKQEEGESPEEQMQELTAGKEGHPEMALAQELRHIADILESVGMVPRSMPIKKGA